MAGKLWVVSTPIGNLADLSPRALETLRTVDLIVAEDTRVIRKLLAANNLHTPVESYREHTRGSREDRLIERLRAGQSLALVTDAGTPNLADPGGRLVDKAALAGIPVAVVPGPSALTAAIAVAGLPLQPFTFYGFLPLKHGRQKLLDRIAQAGEASIFFEGPHRLAAVLADIASRVPRARAVVARELTKVFERVYRGTAQELAQHFANHPDECRGESTIIILPTNKL